MCGYLPRWKGAVGRIKAVICTLRSSRSRSSGVEPGATPSHLHLPAPGQCRARPVFLQEREPGVVAGGSHSPKLCKGSSAPGPAPPGLGKWVGGCVPPERPPPPPRDGGLMAAVPGTRSSFRQGLSHGDTSPPPPGLGVKVGESSRLNKRTKPRESFLGERRG